MKNLNLLSEVLDSVFSSSKAASYAMNYNISGNMLEVKYSTIVHFASESSLKVQLDSLRNRSMQLIDESISNLKKKYREKSDSTLRVADNGGKDDIELISATSNSPRKIAYFRCNRFLEITD